MKAVLLGLAIVVAGCGGGINVARFDVKAKTFTIGPINNGSLQSDAEILNTGRALYQEQLMQCLVEIQSHTNDSQKLYYKFNWQDADGFPLSEDTWHWAAFKGNEKRSIVGTATEARAEKAEFMLRRRSTDDHEN